MFPGLIATAFLTVPFRVSKLRCEGLQDPLNMDVAQPTFSWQVVSDRIGARQTAYELLVTSDRFGKSRIWDSGRVRSAETREAPFGGKPLRTMETVYVRVRAWDERNSPTGWSEPCSVTMGLLHPLDWKASWIGSDQPSRLGIGYHAAESKSLDAQKWVQVDLGRPIPVAEVKLYAVLGHGGEKVFGFPPVIRVETSNDPTFATDLTNGVQNIDASQKQATFVLASPPARYVRVTAEKLWKRKDGIGCFALDELEALSHGWNVARNRPVTFLDSVERDGWTHQALTDGVKSGDDPSATFLLRKPFVVRKPIARALCFVSGVGQYEMWLNGRKVGNNWITPGWTQYRKTVLSDGYDVTNLLRPGKNAAAMHIGNGMYNMAGDTRGSQQPNSLGPKEAICQLAILYKDGSRQTLTTDGSWRTNPSPSKYSGVFGGEDWDARWEQPGWKLPAFNDHLWHKAVVMASPGGVLRGVTHANPPLRVIEIRHGQPTGQSWPDKMVLDLKQNSPYVPQIQVSGPRGTTVKLSPAEILKADGTIDQTTMRPGKYAAYTLAGHGVETWHPSFWYVGSRYWQIEATNPQGQPIDPKTVLKRFDGLLVHAAIRPAGYFHTDNDLLNKIHDLIWWAMASNFGTVISDCPHREKSGWLEQDHLVGAGLMYSFDMDNMFRKVVDDMHDTQQPNGMVPTMAPEYFIYDAGFRDSVEWGASYLLLPEMMRDWYGRRGLVAEHYPSMRRYVDYLTTRAKAGILSNGLGDWTGYGNDARTPVAVTDTAYYYLLTKTLANFAAQLGKNNDHLKYAARAESIRGAFLHAFFDPATGKVNSGSQSCQATALDLGLIPAQSEGKAFDQLLEDVKSHDYAISCGEVGHPSLLRVLSRFGRSDLVAKIHLQTERPGYGYQVKKGLTTLAESWDASLISYNHFMLGHLMEWLYANLAGIKPDPAGDAWSKFKISPTPVPGVNQCDVHYDSPRGRIVSQWKLEDGHFTLRVTVPANSTATIWVPTSDPRSVTISRGLKRGAYSESLKRLRVDAPSGSFVLTSRLD